MGISLCMIVKNEEKHLRDALESVKDHVDEIIIVDTGSTDGTLDIAQEYAHVTENIEWQGFAHARNVSIELASHEVIFILDADERVENPEMLREMEKLIVDEGYDAVAILLHNLLPKNQVLAGDFTKQIRMFPNREVNRYEGTVHNQIAEVLKNNPRDGKEARFGQVSLKIIHHGYNMTPEELYRKYKGRVGEMQKEADRAKKEGNKRKENYYRYQTANAYFMMKQHDTCLFWLRTVDFDFLTVQNAYSACILGSHACGTLQLYDEALVYAKKMLELRPEEGLSFLFMGMNYMLAGKWNAAYTFLGATLALADHLGGHFDYHLDRAYICGPAGECALKLNRLGEAKNLFKESLQTYPDDARVRALHDAIIPVSDLEAGQEKGEILDSRKTDSQQPSE